MGCLLTCGARIGSSGRLRQRGAVCLVLNGMNSQISDDDACATNGAAVLFHLSRVAAFVTSS